MRSNEVTQTGYRWLDTLLERLFARRWIRVRVLHNTNPHAMFSGYLPAHDRLTEVLASDLRVSPDTTDEEIADTAFELCNIGHTPDSQAVAFSTAHRSCSVGDVVYVGRRGYVCADFGWVLLLPDPSPRSSWLEQVRRIVVAGLLVLLTGVLTLVIVGTFAQSGILIPWWMAGLAVLGLSFVAWLIDDVLAPRNALGPGSGPASRTEAYRPRPAAVNRTGGNPPPRW